LERDLGVTGETDAGSGMKTLGIQIFRNEGDYTDSVSPHKSEIKRKRGKAPKEKRRRNIQSLFQ